ncbi:MAG: response regulator, partial [Nitrospinaceae bacterium]|nr:response regulator [Nitrospinaceae bacterium]
LIRDITERHEIDRMKSEFISVVSHEIRTPLTSLRGSLGLLQGGVAGDMKPEGMQLLDIAVNNSERLIRLINDILDLEKIESGTMELRMARVSVRKLVTRSLEEMQGLASDNGVTIEADVETVEVMADGDTIVQVLTNLLSNAIKFSDPGETVSVAARREGGRVKVSVSDHGRGIPADMVGMIFDKFKQVDSSDTREKGGTGLGLPISRAIIEQHGGKIWAESEMGKGSVFHFTLQGSEIKEAVSSALGAGGGKSRPPVLICDDDPDFVRYVRTIIEQEEYATATASSAEEALEYLKNNDVSLLLLDVHLPGMSGIELEGRLRAAPETADLPVIIVSGDEPSDEPGVAGPVIIDWLTKPIDVEKLMRGLRDFIGGENSPDVLVVDDDEQLLTVLSRQIGNLGTLVRTATSGRLAVQMCREKMPDLIILDIVMDDGDGFYVIDALREEIEKSGVPIIVFSASELTGEQRRRVSVGSTLFLTKSKITDVQLGERVVDLLNGLLSGPA